MGYGRMRSGIGRRFCVSPYCTKRAYSPFRVNNFFGKADRDRIERWLKQLTRLGYESDGQALILFSLRYTFPPLVNGTEPPLLGEKYSNCREANLDLGVDKYRPDKKKVYSGAIETVNGFGEVLEWCEVATGRGSEVDEPNINL